MRLYLMPLTGSGDSKDPRRPKYDAALGDCAWSLIDHPTEGLCIVGVESVPDDASPTFVQPSFKDINSQPDVFAFGNDLDAWCDTAALAAHLESYKVPGDCLGSVTTVRQAIRAVAKVLMVTQMVSEVTQEKVVSEAKTLDDPVDEKTDAGFALKFIAEDLGHPVSKDATARETLIGAALQVRDHVYICGERL